MHFANYKVFILIISCLFFYTIYSQNVIIVVIDGARYSETFGEQDTYIPNMWNLMKPQGTIYANFYNDGLTSTNPGHASIASGTWQNIKNDGSERSDMPTIFEYIRKQQGIPQDQCYVVAGKSKLHILSHSSHPDYGTAYRASYSTQNRDDILNYNELIGIINDFHPRLIIANFAQVDVEGHSGVWENYIASIIRADSLIFELWTTIQADLFYQNKTTLFVTNDHGRHDDANGGFQGHGDGCEGCRHLILLAIGRRVSPGQIIDERHDQRDIAPTVGDLMNFTTPLVDGSSLFQGDFPLPVILSDLWTIADHQKITLFWTTQSETNNAGFTLERASGESQQFTEISSHQYNPALRGSGNSGKKQEYFYTDENLNNNVKYVYKLFSEDFNGEKNFLQILQARPGKTNPALTQKSFSTKGFRLYQNYPNPFNPGTIIEFEIPEISDVRVSIYNILGEAVATQAFTATSAGKYQFQWKAENLPGGLYLYRLSAESHAKETRKYVGTRKMVLIQ